MARPGPVPLIAAGVNPKALSTYIGHSSITITLDRYGHLMPGNEARKLICSTPTSTGTRDAERTSVRGYSTSLS